MLIPFSPIPQGILALPAGTLHPLRRRASESSVRPDGLHGVCEDAVRLAIPDVTGPGEVHQRGSALRIQPYLLLHDASPDAQGLARVQAHPRLPLAVVVHVEHVPLHEGQPVVDVLLPVPVLEEVLLQPEEAPHVAHRCSFLELGGPDRRRSFRDGPLPETLQAMQMVSMPAILHREEQRDQAQKQRQRAGNANRTRTSRAEKQLQRIVCTRARTHACALSYLEICVVCMTGARAVFFGMRSRTIQ